MGVTITFRLEKPVTHENKTLLTLRFISFIMPQITDWGDFESALPLRTGISHLASPKPLHPF